MVVMSTLARQALGRTQPTFTAESSNPASWLRVSADSASSSGTGERFVSWIHAPSHNNVRETMTPTLTRLEMTTVQGALPRSLADSVVESVSSVLCSFNGLPVVTKVIVVTAAAAAFVGASQLAIHVAKARASRKSRADKKAFTGQGSITLIGKALGHGAFGDVREATHSEIGIVAVKDVRGIDAARRECQMLQGCGEHPFIVMTYGVDEATGLIVMERCSHSLKHIIKQIRSGKRAAVGEVELRLIARQLLLALQWLHQHNTLHRDIKPDNVLIDFSGRVKLADFGVSRHCDTVTGSAGTPAYCSPEALNGKCTPESDLWSLGCTLSHLVTGIVPWHHFSDRDWCNKHALMNVILHRPSDMTEAEHTPLVPSFLSAEAAAFMKQLLSRDPSARGTCDSLLAHPFIAARDGTPITLDNYTES